MSSRIVIVDDHPSFRASVRTLLEAEGFEVVGEAVDGASGIEAVRRLGPDVVLLDVQLPDIDGFEVAARLGAENRTAAVVLTSSRDASEYGTLASECGARGFIPKAEISGAALAALVS